MRIKTIITLLIIVSFSAMSFGGNAQYLVAHFPMDVAGNVTQEIISGKTFTVQNNFNKPENIPGAEGMSLRCDGYSTFINAEIASAGSSLSGMTASLWCAIETYPVMNIDGYTTAMTYLAGNLNDDSKTGFAFVLNAQGTYGFEIYINGSKQKSYVTLEKLEQYRWVHLAATVQDGKICLYKNGKLIARTTLEFSNFNIGNKEFTIGKSFANDMSGIFRLNTINGLIDDIRIYSTALTESELGYKTPENPVNLSIPESRHENDIQRPAFHGQPATNWTNEPHGLFFYNNKYHIFFQKNANGPYMAKLHWGHLSSTDLINWKEEKIVIGPAESYDIKGTWSGCVFSDPEMTNNIPNIFYTGVDYVKAGMNQATPVNSELIEWTKDEQNPIIPNKPPGLSDDFRDPYIFKFEDHIYMIVGTSKDGCGATTLHRYDKNTRTWSNDGSIFYKATNPAAYGTFWEMPAIVQMNNGNWVLFTTNLGASAGTETLYWVGTIRSDGTFNPYSDIPKKVELFSGKGYGLLSPSIMQQDGKTIAIGIVPDKLPGNENLKLGWAHLYSLPREWTLDADNTLRQRPYEGLKKIRVTDNPYSIRNIPLNGTMPIDKVSGKMVEIDAQFRVSSAQKIGFNVRKNTNGKGVRIYYMPSDNKICVDAQDISRLWNDTGLYNGLYETTLPETFSVGSTMNLHIYIDHSIMDIFVNEKFAFSIRIFPTDIDSDLIDVFSEGSITDFDYLNIWKLDPDSSPVSDINHPSGENVTMRSDGRYLYYENAPWDSTIFIYDTMGRCVNIKKNSNREGRITLAGKMAYIVRIVDRDSIITQKIF